MNSGLLAEFETPERLLVCIRDLRTAGLERMDSFTPWPVKGLDEALRLPRSFVNRATLLGGLTGAALAYFIMWWTNAWDFPLIVGTRPAHAAPAFVPITFETTVLFAGFSAFLSMLFFCGLPALWNPVFDVDGFESATIDRFWLGIDSNDPSFNRERLTTELRAHGALRVEPFGKASDV